MTVSSAYKAELQAEHSKNPNWGVTAVKYAGGDIYNLLETRGYIHTVLDFGCGEGTLKEWLASHFPDLLISEYDPGIPGKDVLPPGQFDLVISTDVLEHVEPHLIDNVIQTLESKTRLVLYSDIACYPTGKTFSSGPYQGEDLHLIQEDPHWWRDKFDQLTGLSLFEYHWVERRTRSTMRKRCKMIHERTNA